MDRIGPPDTAALVNALRGAVRASAGSHTERGGPGQSTDLRDVLTSLVRDVDPDDLEAMARTRTNVLRAILARDWGVDVASDPAFIGMVEAVDQRIGRDERLARIFRDAVVALKAPGRSRTR